MSAKWSGVQLRECIYYLWNSTIIIEESTRRNPQNSVCLLCTRECVTRSEYAPGYKEIMNCSVCFRLWKKHEMACVVFRSS